MYYHYFVCILSFAHNCCGNHKLLCFEQGEAAASFHNRYPEEWGALTKRALTEAQRRRDLAANTANAATVTTTTSVSAAVPASMPPIDPSDVMYFMRSAWIQSPRFASVFWLGKHPVLCIISSEEISFPLLSYLVCLLVHLLFTRPGDQLVSWDSNDGLRSALTGALSSGLVGHAITHSDIGGYTVELDLGEDMYYVRTPELLKRWSEFSAFGFGESFLVGLMLWMMYVFKFCKCMY